MITKLYTYQDETHLVYDDDMITCIGTNNMNMNSNTIKVHKGVDNNLRFKVYNRDRKPQPVNHLQIRTRLVNSKSQEVMLERYATALNEKGVIEVKILEGDLVNIPRGYYKLIVTGGEELIAGQAGQIIQTPFYSDTGNNVVLNIEVTGQAEAEPVPTIEIIGDDWINFSVPNQPAKFYSSAIPAGRIRNTTTSTHTIAIYTTNFSGKVKLYGSLEDVPPQDILSYFPIDVDIIGNEIEFNGHSGITPLVFQANYMWLKFVYEEGSVNNGTINKIQIRN